MTSSETSAPVPSRLAARIRRELRASRTALWIEELARALWPAVSVACLLLAGVLLGLAEGLGAWAHAALVTAGVVALVLALGWGFSGFRIPNRHRAVARLDAADPRRPLAALEDRLAGGGAETTAGALWRAHQARAAAAAEKLRAEAPDLRLSSRDRWALRLFAPVVLVGAFIAAGDGWMDRLAGAIETRPPGNATGPVMAEPAAEAWAVPPAYTGRETVYLTGREEAEGPIELPTGTELTIRVTGVEETPVLEAAGIEGLSGFTSLGAGLHELTTTVTKSGSLAVDTEAGQLARWQVTVLPDERPEIESTATPRPDPMRALEVPFAARDDYGVVAAWATVALADPKPRRMEVDPIEFALPLPISGDTREVEDRAVSDFTTHPWAGAEVLLTLHAEDGAGQVATTDPIRITLPGRIFTDPLARALVDQRLQLILDYDRADHVLDMLQSVTQWPDEVFGDNAGAYLGVRTAIRRLAVAVVDERVDQAAPEVAEFLWRAALALEEGDMAGALERLREAAERLRDALENGTDEEIAQAIEQLRQAMNEYLQQLARQGMQQQQQGQQQQGQQGQQLTQQDLEEMLNQLQDQAQSGMRDQARQMLDQLAQMLENLRPGQQQAGQSPGEQALQQLQEMIQRQRNLSDQTFDQLRQERRQGQQQGQQGEGQMQGQMPGQMPGQRQQGQGQQGQQGQQQGQGRPGGQSQPGGPGGEHAENGRLAAEQEALRRAIEELRDQLGGGQGMDGARRSLDDAERSMGAARDDLSGNQTGEAVQDQMDALDSLNESAEALAQAMQNGQGNQAARGDRTGEGRADDRRQADPFDRPAGAYGAIDGSGTDVPDRALIDRARELLEELRRRSSDRTRPELELDYLERLLEQF